MDIAVVGVGAAVRMEGEIFAGVRIALAAVAPTPLFARKASEFLVGKRLSDGDLERAGELAKEEASPISDMRGTARYRRHLIGVLTRRAVRVAAERAAAAG
jgi:carbon-monoxide dehydrogenase medium subunit